MCVIEVYAIVSDMEEVKGGAVICCLNAGGKFKIKKRKYFLYNK